MWPHKYCQDWCSVCAASMCAWFACILKALSVFVGGFISVTLPDAVGSQVPELVSDPVGQPVLAHIAVVVDKDSSAGQMGEHQAPVASGNVKVKVAGRSEVFPMRDKEDSQR